MKKSLLQLLVFNSRIHHWLRWPVMGILIIVSATSIFAAGPSLPALQVLYSFPANLANGGALGTPLTPGPDGALYGTTLYGGAYQSYGTLFRYRLNGEFTKLFDFNLTNGCGSVTPLQVGPDGALYGVCPMGGTKGDYWNRGYGSGLLFRLETNGNYTILHEFNYYDGEYPASLQLGPDGAFYGTTRYGGIHNNGTFFRLATNGVFSDLWDFDPTDGTLYWYNLTLAADDNFYGQMYAPSSDHPGSIFRLTINGEYTLLHVFDGSDGFSPMSPLTAGADGALYGMASAWGGFDQGVVFRLGLEGTFSKLHNISAADGLAPAASMTLAADGCLYGSFQLGGAYGFGTVFKVDTRGTFVKLHDFDGTDGSDPIEHLAVGADGALYGGTFSGGAYDLGTLYRVDTNGVFAKLYDANGTNGCGQFIVPLTSGPDGNLYGLAPYEGDNYAGVLYRLVLNPASLSPADLLEQLMAEVKAKMGSKMESGSAFQKNLTRNGIPTQPNFKLKIGFSGKKKEHGFDLGSAVPLVVVECKGWIPGQGVALRQATVWIGRHAESTYAPSHALWLLHDHSPEHCDTGVAGVTEDDDLRRAVLVSRDVALFGDLAGAHVVAVNFRPRGKVGTALDDVAQVGGPGAVGEAHLHRLTGDE
jgi:uncharacterized repeat protein (TIGR03803 family)